MPEYVGKEIWSHENECLTLKLLAMTRLTSSLTFYCRNCKKDKQGLSPIEASIIINGQRTFINLPRKERPEDFKRMVTRRQQTDLKTYLDEVRSLFNRYQTELLQEGISITPQTLKETFKNGGVASYTIERLFTDFLTHTRKRVGHDLTQAAYQKYEYVRNLFYKHIDKKKEVSSITCSVIDSFYIYLQQHYNTATSASHMTRLKTIITYGINDGHLKVNPFKNVKVKHSKKRIEYLTEEELKAIHDLEIDNKSLADVRDAFLFQASTGLAYIDLLNLNPEDIKVTDDGTHYITKTRHKTDSEYTTVVLPMGVEVLKRHNYHLRVISNQKYNLFLKTIQALANIQGKTLTTHLARKTFCCLLLNKGVSINTVAKCAGHMDIKITRSYYATLQESTVIKEVCQAIS